MVNDFIINKETERNKHYESLEWRNCHNIGLQILKKLPKGKVLEIGCADGIFLDKLREEGFDVYGLDVYPKWIEKCKNKSINVKCGDANEKLPYKNDFFDYVINFEMIAHLINPPKFIKEVKRVLKKDGKLLIESVNSAYWKYRISYLFAQTNNYQMLWPGCNGYNKHYSMIWPEHKGIHLQHYSLNSCKQMLKDNGFHITDVSKEINKNKLSKAKASLAPNIFCCEYLFVAQSL